MKKISLFFVCLFTILITGCSNDDFSERGSSNTKRSKTAHWYGVKQLQDSISLRSAADRMKLWAQDPVITVKFLNSTDDPAMLDQIKTYAKEWEQYAGITFRFVEPTENALVRIGFDWNDNSWLTWSYTGNDAKMVRSQSEPTACFGGFNDGVMSDEEIKGDVLRVFGQILGLEFEQRHQGWDSSWWKKDKNGVYYAEKYWDGMFDGYYENLDWETIRQFVFDPLAGATIVQTADVDFESIMMWPYYTKKESLKLYANYELSEGDKEFIATLYPKKEGNTIQTAWVDAGYFTWVNAEKTQLRITEKGAKMEYLPDVVDGEQLTSAERMFFHDPYSRLCKVILKKAPVFNTSNITDFSLMFSYCHRLMEVPLYDTSNGTDFTSMFASCSNLGEIPCYDTSNGSVFIGMFTSCHSLKEIPNLNTSKGVDFRSMFAGARITSIPNLDMSKGIDLSGMYSHSYIEEVSNLELPVAEDITQMFYGCWSLKKVSSFKAPKAIQAHALFEECKELVDVSDVDIQNANAAHSMFYRCESLKKVRNVNASSATTAHNLFNGCKSLEEVDAVNISSADDLSSFFEGCSSLTKLVDIQTSSAKDFRAFFAGCRSLENVPLFDTSQAESLWSMFAGCENLKNVPLFNTSKVKFFAHMFRECKNLETIPLLDTSNGEVFYSMFSQCSKLKSIPQLNLSKGLSFTHMFSSCFSLTNVPELNVSKGVGFQFMFERVNEIKEIKLKGFGQDIFGGSIYNDSNPTLYISSPVLDASSLQYLVDNTTGSATLWTVNLNKKIQSKVSPELIAQAAAKNIKFEFIY